MASLNQQISIHYQILIINMSIALPTNPPYESCVGKWVSCREFRKQKSFGYFQCNYCDKSWTSARPLKGFKQGCQACERQLYPAYMWQNEPGNFSVRMINDNGRPHRSDLCQACMLGVQGGRISEGWRIRRLSPNRLPALQTLVLANDLHVNHHLTQSALSDEVQTDSPLARAGEEPISIKISAFLKSQSDGTIFGVNMVCRIIRLILLMRIRTAYYW